eukprot:m51a1_g12365 putative multidrug and toxin extrusion protein 1 (608) ;mRNA; f:583226-585577
MDKDTPKLPSDAAPLAVDDDYAAAPERMSSETNRVEECLPLVNDTEPEDAGMRESLGSTGGAPAASSQATTRASKKTRKRSCMHGWRLELRSLCSLALPLSAAYFLDNSLQLLEIFFIGHIGAVELAAGSLAISLCNITGWAFGFGLLTGLDTLAAQAYGAGKLKRVGVIAQRSAIVVTAYAVPTVVVWYFSEYVLLALRQDPDVASLAAQFILWSIPGLVPCLWFEVVRRYLQAINVVTPVMLIILLSLPCLALLLFVFVDYLEMGFVGCPIAVSIVQWGRLGLLLAYLAIAQPHMHTWPGWSRKAWLCMPQFLKLAIPGALMSCMEITGFEIVTVFAGWLGTLRLAAHSALLSTYNVTYMIPTGFALAVTTRVGNLLGANKPRRARMTHRLGLWICLAVGAATVCSLALFKTQIAHVFTDDAEVVAMFEQYVPLLCIIVMLDGVQIVGGGALRGLGRQRLGMVSNFISFYIVGIPSGYAMAFALNMGVMGLWSGIAICDALSSLFFSVVIAVTNWRKTAEEIVYGYAKAEPEAKRLRNTQKKIAESACSYGTIVAKDKGRWEGASLQNTDKTEVVINIEDDVPSGNCSDVDNDGTREAAKPAAIL